MHGFLKNFVIEPSTPTHASCAVQVASPVATAIAMTKRDVTPQQHWGQRNRTGLERGKTFHRKLEALMTGKTQQGKPLKRSVKLGPTGESARACLSLLELSGIFGAEVGVAWEQAAHATKVDLVGMAIRRVGKRSFTGLVPVEYKHIAAFSRCQRHKFCFKLAFRLLAAEHFRTTHPHLALPSILTETDVHFLQLICNSILLKESHPSQLIVDSFVLQTNTSGETRVYRPPEWITALRVPLCRSMLLSKGKKRAPVVASS